MQSAETVQVAESQANANQNAVNANVPVNVAGGDIWGGNDSANQNASNSAESEAGNVASTEQSNSQSQSDPPSGCVIGCGGNGQAQISVQSAETVQVAESQANACQNAVNANVPVNVAGWDIWGGNDSANQNASNSAWSAAGNVASTSQYGDQEQSS